jgi:carboxyl-terminal processing protease
MLRMRSHLGGWFVVLASLAGCADATPQVSAPQLTGPEARLDAAWQLTLSGYVVPVDPVALAVAADEGMDALAQQRVPDVKPGSAPFPELGRRPSTAATQPIEQAMLAHLQALEAEPGLDADHLSDAAIQAMTTALDPHTKLEEPGGDAIWDRQADTAEHYRGLGFQVRPEPTGYRVTRLYQGGPAAQAGVEIGDLVTALDGRKTASLDNRAFTKLSHGDAATPAKLDIDRHGKHLHLAATRGPVDIPRVEARIVGDVAVLRLNAFTRDAGQELRRKTAQLFAAQPAPRGLVLDLRGNLGGLISEAEDAAGLLLPDGAWLATFWSVGHADERHVARPPTALASNIPAVVLIDGDTASASEVLAAALRDHGRATLIGTPSFGKGISQGHSALPGGRTLVATGWFLRRPSGAWLQDSGLVPDLTVAGLEETYAGHENAMPGALRPPPQIVKVAHHPAPASADCLAAGHVASTKPGDPQLLAAVAVLDCQRSIAPVLEAKSPAAVPDGETRQSGAVASTEAAP